MASGGRGEKWPGGYVREDSRGAKTYVIYKKVMGRLYERSTRARSLRAAMKHLERFEADPSAYDPSGLPDPVYLTAALGKQFLLWSRDDKKNTREWVRKQKRYLDWWQTKIGRDDLRTVPAVRIRELLRGTTAQHHRTAVLKHFYAWLRTEAGLITPAQDPTLGQIKVPAGRASQLTRSKVVTLERFEAARAHLVGVYRDALTLNGATGWHVTEVIRFAQRGAIEPYRGDDASVAGILVCPWHKVGEPHRTQASREAVEAARRLLARGSFSRSRFDKAVKAACLAAGVEPFTAANLRHTTSTLAVESGHSLAAVAGFLGHRSERTTKRFYATNATPTKVKTLI